MTSRRYTVNGVLTAGDDPDSVEFEMDMAWAGATVFRNGAWAYLPGAVRAPVRALTLDDVIEVQLVQLGPDSDDRVNIGLMAIAQDADRDYLPYRLPAQELTDELAIDGARREIDLGQRGFVNTARQAERVLRRKLREARPSILVTLRLMPGPELENMSLHAGDIVTYTDSRYGLEAERCIVQSSTINQDMSVTVALQGTPVLGTSRFTAGSWTPGPTKPRPGKPPKVTGFSVGQLAFSVRVIRFTMPDWSSLSGVRIRYASSNAPWVGMTQLHSGFLIASPFTNLEPTAAGTYWFEARAVSQAGVESDGVRVQATLKEVRDLVDGQDGTDGTDGAPGADGTDGRGPEYVFASSATSAKITGDANLPDPDWNFDAPGANGGPITRGTRRYFDGTPTDLSATRPFLIRFRRPVSGDPAQGEDVGTVAWTQDPAVRVYGQDGVKGDKGDDGAAGDDGARGPAVWHLAVSGGDATTLNENTGDTLPPGLLTAVEDAVEGESLDGDFVRLYHDGSAGRENWWFTYNADQSEWLVSAAFIGAAEIQAVDIQAIRGNLGDLDVAGTISGKNIAADVRNWDRLWGGPSPVGTADSSFSMAASLDDYDNVVATISVTDSSIKRTAFLAFDSKSTLVQRDNDNNTGRDVRFTRSGTHSATLRNSAAGLSVEAFWGVKNPAQSSQIPFAPVVTIDSVDPGGDVVVGWTLATPNPTINKWQYRLTEDGTWTDIAGAAGIDSSTREVTLALSVGEVYAIRVRAINPIGNGSPSLPVAVDWSIRVSDRLLTSFTWPWANATGTVMLSGASGGGGGGGRGETTSDRSSGYRDSLAGNAGGQSTLTMPDGTRVQAGPGLGGAKGGNGDQGGGNGRNGGTSYRETDPDKYMRGAEGGIGGDGGQGTTTRQLSGGDGGDGGDGELREIAVTGATKDSTAFTFALGRRGSGGRGGNAPGAGNGTAGRSGVDGYIIFTPSP